jgi:hypothetical protein
MFWINPVFNQDISFWDISDVENMDLMLAELDSFDQDLSAWSGRLDSLVDMTQMFAFSFNYNQDLSSWSIDTNQTTSANYDQGATTWAAINKPTLSP